MTEILAGLAFIVIGLALFVYLARCFLIEADAHRFGASAGLGRQMTLSAIGALASFGLAVALLFF